MEKKLTFTIDESLHTRFKLACVRERKDMVEILRACIERYVQTVEKRKSK